MEIVSKDVSKSVYDHAEEIFKLKDYIEKEYGRELTNDEFLILSAIVMND